MDPTGTQVVDGRDLTKESTVGGLQYIRRDGSDFDRIFNPNKLASATLLLGVSLDEQNPKLTNIAIHRKPHTVLRRLAVQLRTVFGDAPCLKLSVDGYIPYALLPPQHLTVKTPLRLLQIRCVLVQTTVSFQYPLLITMKKAPCRALFHVALFFL